MSILVTGTHGVVYVSRTNLQSFFIVADSDGIELKATHSVGGKRFLQTFRQIACWKNVDHETVDFSEVFQAFRDFQKVEGDVTIDLTSAIRKCIGSPSDGDIVRRNSEGTLRISSEDIPTAKI